MRPEIVVAEDCSSQGIEILKPGLVKILNFELRGVADVKLIFLVDAYSRDSEDEM